MALSLMNRLVKRYLKTWDRELTAIKTDCPSVQSTELQNIAKAPLFKKFHGAHHFTSVEQFQKKFPLSSWDDLESKISALQLDTSVDCRYYARSAGTTSGVSKLIPTPEYYVRQNHLRGSWYILHTLYQHDPEMSVFKAKNLLIGGSIYKKEKRYTIGDVSGIMLHRIPQFMRPWYVPSIKTAVSPNWEEKIKITSKKAAATDKVTLIGGIPTWVLAVCKNVLEISAKEHLSQLWPDVKAYIHGGVSFAPYRPQFEKLIGRSDFRFIEVYNATEGFFAYQDRPDEEGMLLMCASGIFFEFITLEDYKSDQTSAVDISQVQLDQDYVIVITTSSGLARYVQGDIVRFVTLQPYRIMVTGRISEYINAFGEDLLLSQAEEALTNVCQEFHLEVRDFTVAPKHITLEEKGRHDWYIEFVSIPIDLEQATIALDKTLRSLNANYDQKRTNDLAMSTLQIHSLPTGCVDQYFKSYSNMGGQSKLPKLRNDRKIADRLERIINSMY